GLGADGPRAQPRVEPVAVEAEVLDLSLVEAHVGEADAARDLGGMAAGEREHLVVHVDADHAPLRTDHLGRKEARLAAARAQIENCLTWPQMLGRITAAIVAGEDLPGNGLEQRGIIGGGTAQRALRGPSSRGVAAAHRLLDIGVLVHEITLHRQPRRAQRSCATPNRHYTRNATVPSVRLARGRPDRTGSTSF